MCAPLPRYRAYTANGITVAVEVRPSPRGLVDHAPAVLIDTGTYIFPYGMNRGAHDIRNRISIRQRWYMATTPEGRLKKRVKDYLKSVGAWWFMPVQNGMGVVGIPDFLVCYRGILIGIETKAPLKNPTTVERRWKKATPNQQNRIIEIRRAGGIAEVVDDLEQVKYMIANAEARTQITAEDDTYASEHSLFEEAVCE